MDDDFHFVNVGEGLIIKPIETRINKTVEHVAWAAMDVASRPSAPCHTRQQPRRRMPGMPDHSGLTSSLLFARRPASRGFPHRASKPQRQRRCSHHHRRVFFVLTVCRCDNSRKSVGGIDITRLCPRCKTYTSSTDAFTVNC